MSWKRLIDEKPSSEFRDRVFRKAAPELEKLRSGETVGWMTFRRRLVFAGGLAALAALVFRPKAPSYSSAIRSVQLASDSELLENVEMFQRLDLLEDLDVLEHLTEGKNG